MTTIAELPAGFADKVLSAQSTFRSVMEAMARPGSVHRVTAAVGTPPPMMRGAAAIALTLFDHDTPVWLDRQDVGDRRMSRDGSNSIPARPLLRIPRSAISR